MAIAQEIKQLNDFETFRVLPKGEAPPKGYKRVPYHIVYDVKFDGRRKARLVAGGNWTEPEKEDIYSGVVSIESLRIGFLLSQLNNLEVCAADIGNAYLNARSQEKLFIVAGKDFGELEGRILVLHKALYGLRTSAARFHEHLAAKLRSMGFRPSKSDMDFWIRMQAPTMNI